jgi:lipopolysaccharide/colanic/teichoic acid biosynthesis glycosyltransferase
MNENVYHTHLRQSLPRVLEAVIALVGLVVLMPLLILLALVIAVNSGRPVLFSQVRAGRNGVPFVLYKFRTMHRWNSGPLVTSRNDVRVTRVGRFLRKTKLDELPELWNVLRGDMSLVGPRPEVPRYVDMKHPLWQLVLKARPGITDPTTLSLRNEELLLSQVNGDRERFYMEVLLPFKLRGYLKYLRIRTIGTDVGVLWRTVIAVIFRHDDLQ